jgi:hypothetical protein
MLMTTQDLAKSFTEMCSKGEFDAAGKKFWSDDIVSREPMTGDMAELKGRKAVEGKGEWWYANHTVHNVQVEGPYVHGDQFVVRFKMDVTPKGGPAHEPRRGGPLHREERQDCRGKLLHGRPLIRAKIAAGPVIKRARERLGC